jgi:hypothetical protein
VNGRGLCAERSCPTAVDHGPSPPASGGDHTAEAERELKRVLTPEREVGVIFLGMMPFVAGDAVPRLAIGAGLTLRRFAGFASKFFPCLR